MIISAVLTMLVAGLAVGLVMGLIILCIDRRRKKSTRTLNIKNGITLEYDCSAPGIYETLKAMINGK